MKQTIYLLFLLAAPLVLFSQINYSVKGKVMMPDGYLPTGNVIALQSGDSTFIQGTSFFEEPFELNNIDKAEILIKLTSLQFEDTIIPVEYNGESVIDLGDIIVQNLDVHLTEVVVKSKRPVYIQRPNGTVEVLIENTTLSASNTVNEILSKSPDIISDETGSLSVFGKGTAILYLNGKRITDNQLALISPSNVKKIEIIRNPSAKYDAEGGAVINIVTIKKRGDGYQAKVKQNFNYSNFIGLTTYSSFGLNYNKGRFSSTANYALQLGRQRVLLHTTRDRDTENVFLRTDLTTDWEYDYKNYSYYDLGLQYDLDEASYLSLEYSGSLERLGGNTISNNKITDSDGISFYRSDIDKDEQSINNSISLNFNKSLDTLGSTLFLGGQYSNFDIGADNPIEEESTEQNITSLRFLKNLLNLNIDIFSGQADFTKNFKNKNTVEIGAKYSSVENNFNLDFLVSDDGVNFELDGDISNYFSYRESIAAAYLTFKGNLKNKVNYTLGVRSEYTDYALKLINSENNLITDNYINFFPNLSLTKIFSDNYTMSLSYSSRIGRPPYQHLNPVLIYQDPYTSVQGNPEMQPQKTHAFELNSKIKKTTFKVGYNYTIDPFGNTALRGDDPNSYILKRINYGKQHQFFTSASRKFSYKLWTSTNTLSVKYTNLSENQFNFERVTPRPNFYYYSNNQFDIFDSFNAQVLFWYLGHNYEGLHHRNNMYNITITLEKSFLDNSLKCRLIANDILHSAIASGSYNVGETDVYYNRRWSSNYFRLSLMYNFGKLKKVSYKNKETGKSENRRAQ